MTVYSNDVEGRQRINEGKRGHAQETANGREESTRTNGQAPSFLRSEALCIIINMPNSIELFCLLLYVSNNMEQPRRFNLYPGSDLPIILVVQPPAPTRRFAFRDRLLGIRFV